MNPLRFGLTTLLVGAIGFVIFGKMACVRDTSSRGEVSRPAKSSHLIAKRKSEYKQRALAAYPKEELRRLLGKLQTSLGVGMSSSFLFGFWESLQQFDEKELNALWLEFDQDDYQNAYAVIRMMRWGGEDGPSAMLAVLASEKSEVQRVEAISAMIAWMNEDRDAAYAWFLDHESALGERVYFFVSADIEEVHLQVLFNSDYRSAVEKFVESDSHLKDDLRDAFAGAIASDIERREQLLALLEEHDEKLLLRQVRQFIVRRMSQNPEEAAAFIEEQEIGADERRRLIELLEVNWHWAEQVFD